MGVLEMDFKFGSERAKDCSSMPDARKQIKGKLCVHVR